MHLVCAMHGFGAVLTLWFIAEGWHYYALVYIFLCFRLVAVVLSAPFSKHDLLSLIPAILEGLCIAYHIIIKMQLLQRTASFVTRAQ